jgi:small subunit ribosomal protein S6
MLLLRPDLEDDKLQGAVEKVTRAIVNRGGSLSKVSPWGKRRLAYDIGRHREASYFLIHFDIEPAQVREIERGMLISEEILRHLVTVIEDRGPAEELVPAAAPRAGAESVASDTTGSETDGGAASSMTAPPDAVDAVDADEADQADQADEAEADEADEERAEA